MPPSMFALTIRDSSSYIHHQVTFAFHFRRSDYCDSDGIVALTMGVNYEQLSTAAQRQKFIDAMNVVLGNNTNVRAHIELIRPLPDNQTEVCFHIVLSSLLILLFAGQSQHDVCCYADNLSLVNKP